MFEGRPPAATDPDGTGAAASPLDPLKWAELVARLAAARDLRETLRASAAADHAGHAPASFTALAAAGFPLHRDDEDQNGVNPFVSGKCKVPSATQGSEKGARRAPASRGVDD